MYVKYGTIQYGTNILAEYIVITDSSNIYSSNIYSSNVYSSNIYSSNRYSSNRYSSNIYSSNIYSSNKLCSGEGIVIKYYIVVHHTDGSIDR